MRRALRAQRRTIRKEREPIIGSLSLFAGAGDVSVRRSGAMRCGQLLCVLSGSVGLCRLGACERVGRSAYRMRFFAKAGPVRFRRLRAVPGGSECGVLSERRFPGIVSSSLRLVWYRFGGSCLSPFIGGSFPAGWWPSVRFGCFGVFDCPRFLANFVFGGCRLFREVPGAVCSRQPPPGSFRVLYDGAFRRFGRIAPLHLEYRGLMREAGIFVLFRRKRC